MRLFTCTLRHFFHLLIPSKHCFLVTVDEQLRPSIIQQKEIPVYLMALLFSNELCEFIGVVGINVDLLLVSFSEPFCYFPDKLTNCYTFT